MKLKGKFMKKRSSVERTGPGEVTVEITEQDYREARKRGLTDEETLLPGKHKFIRGGFRKRHPNYDPKTATISVGLYLHLGYAVLEHFKRLAAQPGASSVEEQINRALQQFIAPSPTLTQELLGNANFIAAVAEQVNALQKRKSATRKMQKKTVRRKAA